MALARCAIHRPGYDGEGVRLAGIPEGKGLSIALTRTMTNAEAVIHPEGSAGALVRQLGRTAQDNPQSWAAEVAAVKATGINLIITVNGQILDEPTDIPPGLWREFTVEGHARIPARTAAEVEDSLVRVAAPTLALAIAGLVDDSEDAEGAAQEFEPLPEGARTTVEVNRYERNPVNRMRCISHYGTACWACDMSFERTYGEVGAGYIQVHHRVPVSMLGDSYKVDPIRDLVPLCSNCHSMAHRRNPPYQPDELRALMSLGVKEPPLPPIAAAPQRESIEFSWPASESGLARG